MFLLKILFSGLILLASLSSRAGETESFKVGDCFKFEDFKDNKRIESVVGRIHDLNLGNFEFSGSLYGKKNKEPGFITWKFELPYSKQFKYKKTACPPSLPSVRIKK